MTGRVLKPWRKGDPVYGTFYLPDSKTKRAYSIDARARYILTLYTVDDRRRAIENTNGNIRDDVRERVLELWNERKNAEKNQNT